MNRREFLFRIGGTMVAVPMVLQAIGCGDDDSPAGPNATSWTVTSNADATSHSHTVSLLCSQLTSAGDVVYTTSAAGGGHTHSVTLTPAKLASIAAGDSVTQASDADGTFHGHTWTISKPAGTC